MDLLVRAANAGDIHYAETICQMMKIAAQARGTGIAERNPEYIQSKMAQENAIIALDLDTREAIGFCYIETWTHGKYVANSGLIIHPDYRKMGLARKIKIEIFQLSRKKYPEAKLFGITTGLAVMKINSDMGYKPVTFSELTTDTNFWTGCQGCKNYDILQRTDYKHCLCTAMLYDPKKGTKTESKKQNKKGWTSLKAFLKKSKTTELEISTKDTSQ